MSYEERLLRVVCKAGRILLESGAEIYRVEETINRLLNCFHMQEGSAFVTPSGIFVSFVSNGRTYSKVIRVTYASLNLTRINEVNQASRDMCNGVIDIDELEQRIQACSVMEIYSPRANRWFSAMTALGFALFYGGGIWEAIVAAMAGFCVSWAQDHFAKRKINSFVAIGLCSMLIVLIACLFSMLPLSFNRDTMIIGCMMLLVPGLALTNAIRDSLAGDYLSAITRATEAMLISISLAVGAGIVLSLWLLGGGL